MAGIAHEINNPLTIAFGLLDQAKREGTMPEDLYNKMDDSLVRVRDIVKKIANVTESAKIDYEKYLNEDKMVKLS